MTGETYQRWDKVGRDVLSGLILLAVTTSVAMVVSLGEKVDDLRIQVTALEQQVGRNIEDIRDHQGATGHRVLENNVGRLETRVRSLERAEDRRHREKIGNNTPNGNGWRNGAPN